MEETQTIATIEQSTTETQTTPDTADTQTTEQNVVQSENVENQEPENKVDEATANTEEKTETQPQQKNWEQIAKDNQASFTRVSQELAELKKQVEASKPRLIQDDGKINPEFEQRYKFDIDNREFIAYDNLSRQLEPETRQVVESLLNEAKRLYNPKNNRAYEAKLAEVKDYFRADIVEQIALEKQNLNSQIKKEFNKAIEAQRMEKAQNVANEIEAIPELKELVTKESENYSPDVFDIVKTMFDYTGGVDVQSTLNAINAIKNIGVKEYIAKQEAEKTKTQATVPTGNTVVQNQSSIPSRDEILANPSLYREAVKKYGMDKVDSIIMKG